MVKYMAIWSLRSGLDPNETWKLWREKHAVWAKEILRPELRKYTIARVIDSFGEVDIYGIAQLSFDDVDSARVAINRLLSGPRDEFAAERVTNVRRIIVEEAEIEL